jgi:hypothetical protein
METTTLVPPGETIRSDGYRYWERPFLLNESIEILRQSEERTLESKLWCGLELHRAKLNLSHGSFYPYLWKACLTPTTAWRRMLLATKFMQWAGLSKVEEAMELLHTKSFKLKDFKDYLDEISEPQRLEEFSKVTGGCPPKLGTLLGFSLSQLLHTIDTRIKNRKKWAELEWQEAKDTLTVLADQALHRAQILEAELKMRNGEVSGEG